MVADLEGRDLDGLRRQWRAHLGGEAPAHLPRWLLMRVLAYRLQSDAFGDLDKSIRRNLRSEKDDGAGVPFDRRAPQTRQGVALKAGALLVREWKGRLERVMIMEEGFAWNGQTFGSLSQIAKALLLGLSGIMSEAELHQIRMRLHQGERQKAARGELRLPLPAGLAHDRGGAIIFNPDEEVQARLSLVYAKFRELQSARSVMGFLRASGLPLPVRVTAACCRRMAASWRCARSTSAFASPIGSPPAWWTGARPIRSPTALPTSSAFGC